MTDDTEWIAAAEDLTPGDVIRWTENIWSDRKKGRGKAAKHKIAGKQQVTGQIEEISQEFVHVKVIEAVIVLNETVKPLNTYVKDDTLRKKPQTLLKGDVQRLPWSDEEARAISRVKKD